MVEERYENLNGIRAYACMGIVIMHVLVNSLILKRLDDGNDK